MSDNAQTTYLFQCGDEELFAISPDKAGKNIPRSSCTQGWLLRQDFQLGLQDPVTPAMSPLNSSFAASTPRATTSGAQALDHTHRRRAVRRCSTQINRVNSVLERAKQELVTFSYPSSLAGARPWVTIATGSRTGTESREEAKGC